MEKYTSKEPMTFTKKLENFWYYHKLKVLSAVLIICIILVGVHSCLKRESVDLYVLYMINGAYSTESNEELAKKMEQYVEDLDGDGEKRVQIITISFSEVLERTDRSQEATLSRLVGQIASGPALFYIFDDENYQALKDAKVEIFEQLDGIVTNNVFAESHRFNASDAGFFEGVLGFEDREEPLYFGLRTGEQIETGDSRYPQIKQSRNTLQNIAAAYN